MRDLVETVQRADGYVETFDVVREIMSEVLRIDPETIDLTTSLIDLGVDSLALIDARLLLEEKLGFKLGLRVLAEDLTTMGKLVAYLDAQRREHGLGPSAAQASGSVVLPAEEPGMLPAAGRTAVAERMPVSSDAPEVSLLQRVLLSQMQLVDQQIRLIQGMSGATTAAPGEARPLGRAPAVVSWDPPRRPSLSRAMQAYVETIAAQIETRSPKTVQFARRQRHAAGQYASEVRSAYLSFALNLEPAAEGTAQDLDGNVYLDLSGAPCGEGCGRATAMQAEEVAGDLCSMTGAESVLFFASGVQALHGAVEAARRVTGRSAIVDLRYTSADELTGRVEKGFKAAAVMVDALVVSPAEMEAAIALAAACEALLIVDRTAAGPELRAKGDLTVVGESLSLGHAFGAVTSTRELVAAIPGRAELCRSVCESLSRKGGGSAGPSPVFAEIQALFQQQAVPLCLYHDGTEAFRLGRASGEGLATEALADMLRFTLLGKGVSLPEEGVGVLRGELGPARGAALRTAVEKALGEMRNAGLLPRRTSAAEPAEKPPASKTLRVSDAQREYWAASSLAGEAASANHLTTAVHFRGALDLAALRHTLQVVTNRHESLRASFSADGATQVIAPQVEVECPVVDASADDAASPVDWIARQAKRPFALDRAPLLRAGVLRVAQDDHYLVLVIHHVVADGWSLQVLMGELVELYGAHIGKRPVELGRPHQLSDYLNWLDLQKATREASQAFWLRQIAEPIEPLGLQRARRELYRGASHGASQTLVLNAGMREKLINLSRKVQGSFFSTLLAGLSATLARFSGREGIVIGIASAGQAVSGMPSLVGYCVSQLLLRFSVTSEMTVGEHLRQTRTRVLEAQEYRNYSARSLAKEARLTSNPLANLEVAFNLNRHLGRGRAADGLRAEIVKIPVHAVPFPLNVMAVDDGQSLRVDFQYASDLFDPETIRRLVEGYERVLSAFASGEDAAVWDLDCFGKEDRLLRESWRGETRPLEDTVLSLFEEQASRWGEKVSVEAGPEQVTYRDLNGRANALARHLRTLGAGPEKLVGIFQSRGLAMVTSLWAIWKAGGAYVALDPGWPAVRIEQILEESAVVAVVADPGAANRLGARWREICVEVSQAEPGLLEAENLERSVTAGNLAYVLYTSGSTGTPKGVMVSHGSLLNYVQHVRHTYGPAQGDWGTSLVSSPLAFDLTVTSLVAPLCLGGRVRLMQEESELEHLAAELRAGEYSLVKLTPSHLRALMAMGPEPWVKPGSVWVVGGEALGWDAVRGMSGARVINEYGPTETTVGSSVYAAVWEPGCSGGVPIGRPIANTCMYVLDAGLRPAPAGVEGELYIGGTGLARGYWGHPDWTAERFLPDPAGDAGARMYRTGDRARRRDDGNLEYLGRRDEQVKVRGYRIELGEIEARLAEHPDVKEAVVSAREMEPGDKRLVAYYTTVAHASPEQDGRRAEQLRSFLTVLLPQYMVPSAYVWMEALPLTRNGKVDRNALPAPEQSLTTAEYQEPRTPLEARLGQIWAEVLGVEQVGIDDDFFALGGDSIVLIEMIARARAAQIDLRTSQLTGGATIRAISERLGPDVVLVQDQVPPEGPAVLLPIQHWFFDLPLAQRNHWNQAVLLEIRAAHTPEGMRRTIERLVEQHDALRWRFRESPEGWMAYPHEAVPGGSYECVDLTGFARESLHERITAHATSVQASFDLEKGPLFRAVEFILPSPEANRLLLVAHHLVVDGISWRALLTHLYLGLRQAASGANVIDLGPRTTSAAAWALRLQEYARTSTELRTQIPFWLAQTETLSERIPFDFETERACVRSERKVETRLSQEETHLLLRQLPEVYKTQITEVLVTALCLAVQSWTGGESLLLHLEGHGREPLFEEIDLSRTAGWFTSLYPLRIELQPGLPLEAALLSVQHQLQQVPLRGIGYGLLRYLVQEPAVQEAISHMAEPAVCLNYLGQFDQLRSSQDMLVRAAENVGPMRGLANDLIHALEVDAMVLDGCLRTTFTYSEQRYRPETIEGFAAEFMGSLQALIANKNATEPAYSTSDFPLAALSEQEMQEVLRQISHGG